MECSLKFQTQKQIKLSCRKFLTYCNAQRINEDAAVPLIVAPFLKNIVMEVTFLYLVKDGLGLFYFLAWSATFYPQIFLNYRRKSTTGLSHDFMYMSWIGFIAYSSFTVGGYFSTAVHKDYVQTRGAPPPIEFADVAFATHALVLATLLCIQILAYPPGLRIRRFVAIGCAATVGGIVIALGGATLGFFSWVRVMEGLGAIKVVTSIFKHFPQAISNYRRRSCSGFSFTMIALDVAGSLGSFTQQGVRCLIEGSWAPFTSNLSKLALSIESFLFDMFFLAQFLVYRDKSNDVGRLPYISLERRSAVVGN